jgi:hypothetical protein
MNKTAASTKGLKSNCLLYILNSGILYKFPLSGLI